jgi:spermidine synthase
VLHLGSPVFHPAQVRTLLGYLNGRFAHVSPYGLYIPLYGAYWGLAVASDTLRPSGLATPAVQGASTSAPSRGCSTTTPRCTARCSPCPTTTAPCWPELA